MYQRCRKMCCKYGREVRDRDGIASRIGSEPPSYLHMIDKLTDESKQAVPWTMFPEDIVIFSRKSGCWWCYILIDVLWPRQARLILTGGGVWKRIFCMEHELMFGKWNIFKIYNLKLEANRGQCLAIYWRLFIIVSKTLCVKRFHLGRNQHSWERYAWLIKIRPKD